MMRLIEDGEVVGRFPEDSDEPYRVAGDGAVIIALPLSASAAPQSCARFSSRSKRGIASIKLDGTLKDVALLPSHDGMLGRR